MTNEFRKPEAIRGRAPNFWDPVSRLTGGEHMAAAVRFANRARDVGRARPADLKDADIAALARLAEEALDEVMRDVTASNPNNPFAQFQAQEAAKAQMRAMVQTVQFTEALQQSPDYLKLLKDLSPKDAHGDESAFERKTSIRGKTRADLLERQVHQAVQEADRAAAAKRVAAAQKAAADKVSIEQAQKTFLQMVKQVRKKKKSAVDPTAPEAVEADDNAPKVTRDEAEELAQLALEAMRSLRAEVAPKWAPTQQPWLLNAADKEVFETCLAIIPKELFEQTQAFAGIQDLRRREGAFSTRAAERTEDAVRRN